MTHALAFGVFATDAECTRARRFPGTVPIGCRCFLCGISPAVASTIVTVGVDLREVQTFATLAAALGSALVQLGVRVERR